MELASFLIHLLLDPSVSTSHNARITAGTLTRAPPGRPRKEDRPQVTGHPDTCTQIRLGRARYMVRGEWRSAHSAVELIHGAAGWRSEYCICSIVSNQPAILRALRLTLPAMVDALCRIFCQARFLLQGTQGHLRFLPEIYLSATSQSSRKSGGPCLRCGQNSLVNARHGRPLGLFGTDSHL